MGGGERRIQNQYIFTNTLMLISTTFVHVIKYLFLQTDCRYSQLIHSVIHSGGDPVVTSSNFCSITRKGVTAHPSFLIVTLIHPLTIAVLVSLASKPLLWLSLGLWTPKPLGQQQACLIEVFPMICITDPMVIIITHCPIDLTWQNGKVLDLIYRQYNKQVLLDHA